MRDNKGRFIKGSNPWNKNVKGIHLHKETEFKVDQYVGDNHPSWKGGEQKPKGDCVYSYTGKNTRVRRPRKIWEEHHGPIPDNHVIIHKDGDKHNDDIENLDCISRADNLKRNNVNRKV